MKLTRKRIWPLIISSAMQRSVLVTALLSTVLVGISDAGISGVGRSIGRITQFGSIFVNNREIEIGTASITIDGMAGTEADLRLGQVVLVRGAFDNEFPTGYASDVVFADNVEGPISSIDDGRLMVLGQSILTDKDTIVVTVSGSSSVEDLSDNDKVEVSGFLTAGGEVLASRIEQKSPGGLNEVSGTVRNLTTTSFTFNGLTVDFSGAVLNNFPLGSITEGDQAEAKGLDFGANGEFIAAAIDFRESVTGESGELGELEGLITDLTSTSDFSIAEVPVSTDGQTLFIGGGAGNLTTNSSVEVLGKFDAGGTLVADQVTIHNARIRIEGTVDSVLASSISVFEIPVSVQSNTKLKDNSSLRLKPFTLSDLYTGDFVEIRSFTNPPAGTPVKAQLIKRTKKPRQEVRLDGFAGSAGIQNFNIYGVTIETDEDTEFRDANDKKISASDFFSVLAGGTFVKTQGTKISSTEIKADLVELSL